MNFVGTITTNVKMFNVKINEIYTDIRHHEKTT